MELILGCNSYLGEALATARREADCVLHSRLAMSDRCTQTALRFVREDLLESYAALGALSPETVYLLARPLTQDASVLMRFAANVQSLLRAWAERGCLKRVVFASTQLVYATPADDMPLAVASLLGPEKPYDCHKAEMEFFLSLLAHHASGVQVEVYRLPLLAGARPTEAQLQQQFLFLWRAAYQAGAVWKFPDEAASHKWGNSWAHAEDVADVMTRPQENEKRFCVVQPVSGHATYWNLDQYFRANCKLPVASSELYLPKTAFFLADNAGLKPRGIAEAFGPWGGA